MTKSGIHANVGDTSVAPIHYALELLFADLLLVILRKKLRKLVGRAFFAYRTENSKNRTEAEARSIVGSCTHHDRIAISGFLGSIVQ